MGELLKKKFEVLEKISKVVQEADDDDESFVQQCEE